MPRLPKTKIDAKAEFERNFKEDMNFAALFLAVFPPGRKPVLDNYVDDVLDLEKEDSKKMIRFWTRIFVQGRKMNDHARRVQENAKSPSPKFIEPFKMTEPISDKCVYANAQLLFDLEWDFDNIKLFLTKCGHESGFSSHPIDIVGIRQPYNLKAFSMKVYDKWCLFHYKPNQIPPHLRLENNNLKVQDYYKKLNIRIKYSQPTTATIQV